MAWQPGRDWNNTSTIWDHHNDSWVELAYHEKDPPSLGIFHRLSTFLM
jgi:hypothetical protein